MKSGPRYEWFDIYESEIISNSPILETNTLYFVEFDFKQIAYSEFPPSKYTGDLNSNEVAIDPSAEVWTSSGVIATLVPGIIFSDGTPFFMGLICISTGILFASFVLKKISHLVIKIPVSSSTLNDCASGSYHAIVFSWEELVDDPDTSSVSIASLTEDNSNSGLSWTSGDRTDTMLSLTVSIMPEDVNVLSALDVISFVSLLSLLVKVNVFSPDSKFGFETLVESGI